MRAATWITSLKFNDKVTVVNYQALWTKHQGEWKKSAETDAGCSASQIKTKYYSS